MSHQPKNQDAIQDDNRFPALTGHSGTAGTAEVRKVVVTNGELHTRTPSQLATGGGTASFVYETNLALRLGVIETQLKIMNVHLSRITGEELNETDIDEGVI